MLPSSVLIRRPVDREKPAVGRASLPTSDHNEDHEVFDLPSDAGMHYPEYSETDTSESVPKSRTKKNTSARGSQACVMKGRLWSGEQLSPIPVALKQIHADVQREKLQVCGLVMITE